MKKIIDRDEQILLAQELAMKLTMLKATILTSIKTIDLNLSVFDFDKDILGSVGVVHDGLTYMLECLDDTVHDSDLPTYRTAEELADIELGLQLELTYKDTVRSIYTENKL